jgi:hypothetical protein
MKLRSKTLDGARRRVKYPMKTFWTALDRSAADLSIGAITEGIGLGWRRVATGAESLGGAWRRVRLSSVADLP